MQSAIETMLLLNIFVNNILPVLLLSGTGFALEKTLHVDARPLGRVIFYILSPVLVFNLHTSNELPFDRIGLMVGFTATGSLIISGLAFLIGKLFRLDRGALIIVIVTSMCVNAGNLCHPVGNAFSLYEMELA